MRSAGYFLPRYGLIPNTVLTAVIMRHRNSGKFSTKLSGISALMDMDASRNQLPVPANTVEKISLPMGKKKISAVHPAHPNTGLHILLVHIAGNL